MIGSRWPLILVIASVGLAPAVLPGCLHFGRREKAREIVRGRKLFQTHCLGCHGGKIHSFAIRPPPLAGIFQHKYLPSGAPATDDQVRATIQDGRAGIMPPFQNVLSSQDIRDIIVYLHTLKPSQVSDASHPASGT